MKLWTRLRTLRVVLPAIMLLCWLLPLVVLGGYMATGAAASLKSKTESALSLSAEHAEGMTAASLNTVIALARGVVYDGELSDVVARLESGDVSHDSYYLLVRDYLDRKFSREDSCTFALFVRTAAPEEIIYTSQTYSAAVHFQQDVMGELSALSQSSDTHCRFLSRGGRVYLVRNLHNARMRLYGMLVIGLDGESLLAPLKSNADTWSARFAMSVDDWTQGAFVPGAEDGLSERDGTLCRTDETELTDGTLRYQVQAESARVYSDMINFNRLLALLCLLMIPVGGGVMLFVHRRILKPVALLSDASDRIRGGELGVVVPMKGADELGRLGAAFSDMSRRIKELIDKSYREEIALRDARIQALQSRINPHFLNNALEAINWQARMDGAEQVGQMVETLSVLLNAALDRSDRHLVPLREELSIADAYFYFVGLQFGKRLTVEKSVDERLLDVPVPRLVVQTLIENAVEHGVAPAGGGCIRLNVFERGG
ncbi:MAG: histidine kinase, partial [Eubacteriales bacterium]|nr:histidine kinase [Eubacteriales bacterium]